MLIKPAKAGWVIVVVMILVTTVVVADAVEVYLIGVVKICPVYEPHCRLVTYGPDSDMRLAAMS